MALVVTVAFLGGCAARDIRPVDVVEAVTTGVAASMTGGLIQVALFTLAEILEMQRELTSAEELAEQRRAESEQASARASAAALSRSLDSPRLSTEATKAASVAAEADAALLAVEAELAERLGLTAVPEAERAAAVRARLAELEAELIAAKARP